MVPQRRNISKIGVFCHWRSAFGMDALHSTARLLCDPIAMLISGTDAMDGYGEFGCQASDIKHGPKLSSRKSRISFWYQ